MKKTKVLFLVNKDNVIYNFRRELAFELLDKLEFNKTDLKSGKKKIPTFYAMYLEALSESDFLNTDVALDDFLKKLKNIT